ncbi:AAA family ATPase [Aurantibacter sp.]|uniref:AAA family ATPase n=1 Tax=Aurantibacter sp. TaxID=2807103 RepID=UPI0035C7A726
MITKKIVIIGGPSTGKSSVINALKAKDFTCFEEISRQVILDARKDGINQLFLEKPLLFSELLLKGREQQFIDAGNSAKEFVFLDRGIPDTVAYMDYVGQDYPEVFTNSCKNNIYDYVFVLAPWKDIYVQDNERYETFEQAQEIHKALLKTYKKYGYKLIDVPFGNIEERINHIINVIKAN